MQAMTDVQPAAWHDDGTESGLHRVALVRGDLVRMPFRPSAYASENVGGTLSYQRFHPENPNGSNTALYMSVPLTSAGTPAGIRVVQPFYGRVFGLCLPRTSVFAQTAPTVSIDGVAYPTLTTHPLMDAEGWTYTDVENCQIIAEDLSEGVHYADIYMPASTTQINAAWLFGYLVEGRAGYVTPKPGIMPISQTVITTSMVAVSTTVSQGPGGVWVWTTAFTPRVRKIVYTNTSASPVLVTLEFNAITQWQSTIAANGSDVFDYGELVAIDALTKHKAATGAVINATVYGGY